MDKKIRDVLNGDMGDPLTQLIITYTCTYVLSIIFSMISYEGMNGTNQWNLGDFLIVLSDCIVPTTATLVLGNLFQNFISACQARATRIALSFWTLIAVIAYMLLYPLCRCRFALWFFVVVLLASAGIVVLGMYAVVQVSKESVENMKSLSG